MPDSSRPRIAWFTPLRPVESGISLYNEELLPILASVATIDVVIDNYRPTHLPSHQFLSIVNLNEFHARDRQRHYDAVVYQMGNSPAHSYMYQTALERPGILVLHDTLLHHLVLSMMLGKRGAPRYRRLMADRYGERGREVAERVIQGQTPPSLFEFPLSEDLIDAAHLIIVHSEYSRAQVLSWRPNARVVRIPMGIVMPQVIDRHVARRHLGLPDDLFVISSITHVNPYKRLDVVLRAARRLSETHPVRLIVAGSVSPSVPLGRQISLLGMEEFVEIIGYVDDPQARLLAAASDAIANLRFPTAGETSASLLRTMAAGRSVIVTDAGSFCELPDDTVAKVPADALEEETLTAYLHAFAEWPELAAALGQNARRFIEHEHSLKAMADGYRRVIESITERRMGDPIVVHSAECFSFGSPPEPAAVDPLLDSVGQALSELGLGGDLRFMQSAAQAASEIGLGAGKMSARDVPLRIQGDAFMGANDTKPISDELLEILACPVCKTAVRLEDNKLVCDTCGRRYRIDDGIPIMLIDEAELPEK